MHVFTKKPLREAGEAHPNIAGSLNDWYSVADKAKWRHIEDVREIYPDADKVGNCTVFNIGGKKGFRLVVHIRYDKQRIYVRRVMSHTEYSRGNWKDDC